MCHMTASPCVSLSGRTVACPPPGGVHVVVRPLLQLLLGVLVDALLVGLLRSAVLCELLAFEAQPLDLLPQVVHGRQLADGVPNGSLDGSLEEELLEVRAL